VRRIEHQLEHRFGFLIRDVGLNGQRCRYRVSGGTEFRQGLVFSPLIDKILDLQAIAQQIENARAQRIVVKQKISAAKRSIKENLVALRDLPLDSASLKQIEEVYQNWPTKFYASVPLETLQEHLGQVLDLHDKLTDYIQQTYEVTEAKPVDTKLESAKIRPKMSGPAVMNVRPYIQDTNQETYVSSKTGAVGQIEQQGYKNKPKFTNAISDQKSIEKNKRGREVATNSEFTESLTPEKLFRLCSQTMQDNIRLYQGQAPYPTELNFTFAALDQAHALGITKWAYDYATQQMGDLATALCILIIDRNIHHPVTPIKSPGGVLRAMTARHAKGELNIGRSFIALAKRIHQSV